MLLCFGIEEKSKGAIYGRRLHDAVVNDDGGNVSDDGDEDSDGGEDGEAGGEGDVGDDVGDDDGDIKDKSNILLGDGGITK